MLTQNEDFRQRITAKRQGKRSSYCFTVPKELPINKIDVLFVFLPFCVVENPTQSLSTLFTLNLVILGKA